MTLRGDISAITAPGQFVNIQLSGMFLRRPISVCDYDAETLTIVYKVVGKGTEAMSVMAPGKKLDILTGLGNGSAVEQEFLRQRRFARAVHAQKGEQLALPDGQGQIVYGGHVLVSLGQVFDADGGHSSASPFSS